MNQSIHPFLFVDVSPEIDDRNKVSRAVLIPSSTLLSLFFALGIVM
jgi:hypothetical protein